MVVVSPNFSAPVEGILFQSPATKLLVNDQELGTATLYITEHNVVWGGGVVPSGGPAPTINLLYPTISLHGIQREPSPALFMVLDYELRLPELSQQAGSGDDDDFDADDQPITQLRFVPVSEHDLQPMYSALIQGQALHPDPGDEVDDDDDNDEHYMDGEEFEEGDEQFEDAVAEEEGAGAAGDAAAQFRTLRIEIGNGADHVDGEDADIGEE